MHYHLGEGGATSLLRVPVSHRGNMDNHIRGDGADARLSRTPSRQRILLRALVADVLAAVCVGATVAATDVTLVDAALGAAPLLVAYLLRHDAQGFQWSARVHLPACVLLVNVMVLMRYDVHWLFAPYAAAFTVMGYRLGDQIEERRSRLP